MINGNTLDELMKLRAAATPGPWKHKIVSKRDGMGFIWPFSSIESEDPKAIENEEASVTDSIISADAAYIVAACNAIPELVTRIKELEQNNREELSIPKEFIMKRVMEVE